jgi:hypothetical protein
MVSAKLGIKAGSWVTESVREQGHGSWGKGHGEETT